MGEYINHALSHVRCERAGGLVGRGSRFVVSGDRERYLLAEYGDALVPVDAEPTPAPEAEPAPAPEAKPVEREPLGGLHHAKLAKLAKALGYTGDDVGKDASLAFLNEKCEPAEVAATREGLGY